MKVYEISEVADFVINAGYRDMSSGPGVDSIKSLKFKAERGNKASFDLLVSFAEDRKDAELAKWLEDAASYLEGAIWRRRVDFCRSLVEEIEGD